MAKKAQLPHPERTTIVHLITNLLPSHMWSGKQSGTDFEPYFIGYKNTMGYKILQTQKKWANREYTLLGLRVNER
jgi:hypothetical protein